MSFAFRYSARLFDDLQNGHDYYIQHAPQAADNFLEDIENTIQIIKDNPYTFSKRYDDIRCGIPKNFPYLIHYSIIEKELTIVFIAIVNTYQKPLWL